MEEFDEKKLVKHFLETRSEVTFRQIYRLQSPALYKLTLRLVNGDRDVAAEVMQDTWMRAITGLPKFMWKSSFKTWLSAIAINCYREWCRKNRGTNNSPIHGAYEMCSEDKMDVNKALCTISPGYREILILHDVEGYTHEEIGSMLGVSAGTSKSQLHHARRAIQKLIK